MSASPRGRLLVTADDRTGALETAGALADAGLGPVRVTVAGHEPASGPERWVGVGADGALVIDVATRHASPDEAAARVDAQHRAGAGARWHGHKIDSTLRGMWAHEVAALAANGRVLLVPAFPAAGRTCRGGVVRVDGLPVHESAIGRDRRAPVRSSRPVDHLVDAGLAPDAVVAIEPQEVGGWLRSGGARVAVVVEVPDDAAVATAVRAWHTGGGDDGVLVGPAGVLGTLARLLAEALPDRRSSPVPRPASDRPASDRPAPARPVLVVVGSAHPVARAQVAALRSAGLAGVELVVTPEPDAGPDGTPAAGAAERTLAALRTDVRAALGRVTPATVLLVGGDTAATVLGDATVEVQGTIATGMPWGRLVASAGPLGSDVLVITKPGGFGDVDALVRVLRDRPEGRERMG